jgi:hypothetical protein
MADETAVENPIVAKLKGLLDTFNVAKLSLDTLSGLIVTVSILLFADAFSSSHLVKGVFANLGVSAAAGLFFLVGSAVTGLLVSMIFQTFGRDIAERIWKPLRKRIEYRNQLMKKLGFTKSYKTEFEWIYSTRNAQIKNDAGNESKMLALDDLEKLIKYTEVAGGSAWAMFLLSPAVAVFLSREYGQPNSLVWWVAIGLAIGSVILMYTSYWSLSKYEGRKTVITLHSIRKSARIDCIDVDISKQKIKYGNILSFCPLLFAIVPVLITWILLSVSANPLEEDGMQLISKKGTNNEITKITFVINLEGSTPDDRYASAIFEIKAPNEDNTYGKILVVNSLKIGKVGDNSTSPMDIVQAVSLKKDSVPWSLWVSFDDVGPLKEGDFVYVNALLSFTTGGNAIPYSKLVIGEWNFPILVNDGKTNYLLGYIDVKISQSTTTAPKT